MTLNDRLISKRFPRSNAYHPEWVIANASGGANALWLTEWLASTLDLGSGMKVLDLGCGLASSSIFLSREFNVMVWATDLWFSASENLRRIRDAGVETSVYPIHADARSLPFAKDFFDAIVSIDSFPYYGTDDHYLNYLARFVKPGGVIATAGAGLIREIEGPLPDHLQGVVARIGSGAAWPFGGFAYSLTIARDSGLPNSAIRFNTLHPIIASLFCDS